MSKGKPFLFVFILKKEFLRSLTCVPCPIKNFHPDPSLELEMWGNSGQTEMGTRKLRKNQKKVFTA